MTKVTLLKMRTKLKRVMLRHWKTTSTKKSSSKVSFGVDIHLTRLRSLTRLDLLCPLTNAAELPTHPSLSKPYLDKGLPEMIRIAEETLHKEQEILWKMKEFFIQFRGDATWAPVGEFHTGYDDFINGDTPLNGDGVNSNTSPPGHGGNAPLNGSTEDLKRSIEMVDPTGDGNSKGHTADTDATAIDRQLANEMEGAAAINGKDWAAQQQSHTNGAGNSQLVLNGTVTSGDHPMAEAPGEVSASTVQDQDRAGEGDDDESQPQSHRMTTRAQAQRSASISRSSSPASSIPHIHPIFQFPVSAVPDPYAGLPLNDASATTTCLLQYVSKQEEIVRATKELYDGLLRALKMRKDVLKWSKAEGHVGEMSDGEDWYDREEWGLDQDLIKGREEEEDETAIAPGKKTRRGRAVKD